MTKFYPPISKEALVPFNAVLELCKKNPGYLTDPACPYPDEVKQFILKVARGAGTVVDEVALIDLSTPEALGAQLTQLYSRLVSLGNGIEAAEPGEKIQWAKASTSLLERLVSLRERDMNIKSFSEFQKVVLTLLEEVLTPAQRTDFVERLGLWIQK